MDENTKKEKGPDGVEGTSEELAEVPSEVPAEIESQVERINRAIMEVPEEHFDEVMSLVFEKKEVFQGPLPHPNTLREYEDVSPGAAKKIINMAVDQQNHRIRTEDKVVTAEIESGKRGQWMGFSIVVIFLVISAILLVMGKSSEGFIALGGTGATVIGLFVYGKHQVDQNNR